MIGRWFDSRSTDLMHIQALARASCGYILPLLMDISLVALVATACVEDGVPRQG
jgi:hypothetical protein